VGGGLFLSFLCQLLYGMTMSKTELVAQSPKRSSAGWAAHSSSRSHPRSTSKLYNHINISHVILLFFNQHHFRHNHLVLENKLTLFNYKF
jgi:hypothetical protein